MSDAGPVITESDLQAIADRLIELVDQRADARSERLEANATVEHVRHGLTRFAGSFIHQHVGEETTVVRLVLALDGRTASCSTTRTEDEALDALVEQAITSAAQQPTDPDWPGATSPAELVVRGHHDEATAAADPDERAAGVAAFVEVDAATDAAGYLDTEAVAAAFASTAGQRCRGASTRATIDGIHRIGTAAGSGHQTSFRLDELDAGAAGRLAVGRAHRSVDAQDIEPGRLPVVLGPEAVATILTFLAVYGFNAKAHQEGASFVELGTQQFDEAITLWQDPADERAIGLPFDAEGTPRQRFPLIERGVTGALAHDRRTAHRAGGSAVSNGCALPGGSMGAIPNTVVLASGDTDTGELCRRIGDGLLITQFHYVRVLEPKQVTATGLTRNGTFLVQDGEIAGAVGNLRFTESFVGALGPGRVLGVGDDQRYADGEFGAGMVIAPSLALSAWNFTGGARG